jgi:hypothetical protein
MQNTNEIKMNQHFHTFAWPWEAELTIVEDADEPPPSLPTSAGSIIWPCDVGTLGLPSAEPGTTNFHPSN